MTKRSMTWERPDNRERGPSRGRVLPMMAALLFALLLAACGSDDGSDQAEATGDSTAPEAEADDSTDQDAEDGDSADNEADTEDETESSDSEDAADDTAPPRTPRSGEIIYPIFGGTALMVPDGLEPFSEGDYLALRAPGDDARVVMARVAFAGGTLPVTTIDKFLEVVAEPDDAAVAQTDESLDVFDTEFAGYTIRSEGPTSNGRLFPSQDPGNVSWSPLPNADLFLAETEDALLVLGVVGESVEAIEALRPDMEAAVASMELTSIDGRVPAVNYPQDALIGTIGEPEEIVPLTAESGGPVGLTELFAPVPAGEVQLVNLGTPVVLDMPDGWFVQPNFPGFVALTDGFGAGPGDRDVVFMMNPNSVSAHLLGVERDGEPIPITVESLMTGPPGNLVVETIEETTIDGKQTAVVDLSIAQNASCRKGDACLYAMTSANPGLALFLKPGTVTRTWWVTIDADTTLLVAASVPSTDTPWLDQLSDGLLSGMRFS